MHVWKAIGSTYPEGCVLFMLNKIKNMWLHRKWTYYLFYDGVMIKKVKLDENIEIAKEVLRIRVLGHKHLFGKNNIILMVKPIRLLKLDVDKKKAYFGVRNEIGVEI